MAQFHLTNESTKFPFPFFIFNLEACHPLFKGIFNSFAANVCRSAVQPFQVYDKDKNF